MKVVESLMLPPAGYTELTLDGGIPHARITHVVCDGERYKAVFCMVGDSIELFVKGLVDLTGKEVSFE